VNHFVVFNCTVHVGIAHGVLGSVQSLSTIVLLSHETCLRCRFSISSMVQSTVAGAWFCSSFIF